MTDENLSYEEALKAVKKNGLALDYLSGEFKANLQIVGAAVERNHNAMQFVSEDVLKDPMSAFWLLESNYLAFIHFPEEWKENPRIVATVIEKCMAAPKPKAAFSYMAPYLSPSVLNSKDFKYDSFLLKLLIPYREEEIVPDVIKWSKPFILAYLKGKNSDRHYDIALAPAKFVLDEDFIVELLKIDNLFSMGFLGQIWKKLGKAKDDLSLLSSFTYNPESFKTCNKKTDKAFVRLAIKVNPLVINYLEEPLKSDPDLTSLVTKEDLALATVKKDYKEYFKLDETLQANPEILARAINSFSIADTSGWIVNHKPNEIASFISKINPKLWEDPKFVASVALKAKYILPDEIIKSAAVAKEAIKLSPEGYEDLVKHAAEHLYSAQDIRDLELCRIEHYPNQFKYLNKKFRTSQKFMQDALLIPSAKPFAEKFLADHHLTVGQLISDEDQTEAIKQAVERAQIAYAAWSIPKPKESKHEGDYKRSKSGYSGFSLSSLSWFRHGQKGRTRSLKLRDDIKAMNEWETWQAIKTMLSNVPFHEHSFSSFLIDELKTFNPSPFANISFSKDNHNRYSRSEVLKALSNFLEIRDPDFEKVHEPDKTKFNSLGIGIRYDR